jgi:hypothetical protein
MPRKQHNQATGSHLAPRLAGSDLGQLAVDGGELRVERVEVAEHVLERGLCERVVETLAAHPGAVLERPGLLPLPVDAPVAQQLLPGPVAGRGTGTPQVVAAAHQITQALLLRSRRPNERELARPIQTGELACVTAVGLHPVARPHRDQRRRDDVAGHTHRHQQPVGVVAARAGLVTDREPLRPTQSADQTADRLLAVLQLGKLHLPALCRQDTGRDRILVHVQGDPDAGCLRRSVRANVRHGWPSFSVCGSGQSGHLNPPKLTRDRCGREGQPRRIHAD